VGAVPYPTTGKSIQLETSFVVVSTIARQGRRWSAVKTQPLDAQTLARLARIDPKFLCPVKMLAAYLAGKASVADELVFPPEAGTPLNGSNAYHGTSFLR